MLIQDNGTTEINIFIHGYNKSSEVDFKEIIPSIRKLELPGKVYVLFWISSFKIFKTSFNDYINSVLATFDTPKNSLISIPLFIDYPFIEDTAEKIGENILDIISKIKPSKKLPINLISFSLGARVIHFALKNLNWDQYNLNNVILMAGATSNDFEDWQYLDRKVNGKIYNFYSKKDLSLFGKFTSTIGRNPIENKSGKVLNIEVDYGHSDYMDNLYKIFNIIKYAKKFKEAKYLIAILKCYCPFCKEKNFTYPNYKTICTHCGKHFAYNPVKDNYKLTDLDNLP